MKRFVAVENLLRDRILVADVYSMTIEYKTMEEIRKDLESGLEYDNAYIRNRGVFIKDKYIKCKGDIIIARYSDYAMLVNGKDIIIVNIPHIVMGIPEFKKAYNIPSTDGMNDEVDKFNAKLRLINELDYIAFAVNEEYSILCGVIKDVDKSKTIKIPKCVNIISRYVAGVSRDFDRQENMKIRIVGAERLLNMESLSIHEMVIENTIDEFKNLKYIGDHAFRFYVHKNLKLENIRYIGSNAFCFGEFESLYIEDGPIVIKDYAFQQCVKLRSVRLPAGLDEIPTGMFKGCSKLEKIETPSTCKIINKLAFDDCQSLESVILSEGLKHLQGYGIFDNCNKLKHLRIPKSVEYIDYTAIKSGGLKVLEIPQHLYEKYKFSSDVGCKILAY